MVAASRWKFWSLIATAPARCNTWRLRYLVVVPAKVFGLVLVVFSKSDTTVGGVQRCANEHPVVVAVRQGGVESLDADLPVILGFEGQPRPTAQTPLLAELVGNLCVSQGADVIVCRLAFLCTLLESFVVVTFGT